ncbi:hypothetical protein QE152_g4269 [Popillia japonica]|uniref:C2H2-type domain-containing protein n=1 Tax=Popillia japonica TaxID=7064 RepID=A0AAW1N0R5_POPJA
MIQITLLENQCPICREICSSRQLFTEHLQSHKDHSQCQLCTYDETKDLLTERSCLTTRARIHTRSMPFQKYNLVEHDKHHIAEKLCAYDKAPRKLDTKPFSTQQRRIQTKKLLLNSKVCDKGVKPKLTSIAHVRKHTKTYR